jgi:hypothetical protein
MSISDIRGVPTSTSNGASLDGFERALRQLQGYEGDPVATMSFWRFEWSRSRLHWFIGSRSSPARSGGGVTGCRYESINAFNDHPATTPAAVLAVLHRARQNLHVAMSPLAPRYRWSPAPSGWHAPSRTVAPVVTSPR